MKMELGLIYLLGGLTFIGVGYFTVFTVAYIMARLAKEDPHIGEIPVHLDDLLVQHYKNEDEQ